MSFKKPLGFIGPHTGRIANPNSQFNFNDLTKNKHFKNAAREALKESPDHSKIVDHIGKIAVGVVGEAIRLKIGNALVSTLPHVKDLLSGIGQSHVPIIHTHTNLSEGDKRIKKSKLSIGGQTNSNIRSLLNGPQNGLMKRKIFHTEVDYLHTENRRKLVGQCGINQRGFDFLMDDTFLSLAKISELTNMDEIRPLIQKQINQKLQIKENNKSLLRAERKSEQKIRYYSAITKTHCQIKIRNVLPSYNAHVRLHLARFNSMKDTLDINSFVDTLIARESVYEVIRKEDLFETYENPPFKRHLSTSFIPDLKRLEAFNERATIVETWEMNMPSGSQWWIDFTEYYKDGIYLDRLFRYEQEGIPMKSPSGYFFIIEYFGDRSAAVHRKADKDNFYSVYSPVNLQYEYKFEYSFAADVKKNEDATLWYPKITKSTEFEDEALGLSYYPDRIEGAFTVNFNNLEIGTDLSKEGKEKKFKLLFSGNSLETTELTEAIRSLSKIDEKAAENLTEEDLRYNNTNTEESSTHDELGDAPGTIADKLKKLRGGNSGLLSNRESDIFDFVDDLDEDVKDDD